MPIVIDEILAGKAIDAALKNIGGAWRAFSGERDSLGRLLVLLHADFGDECALARDAFYSWRKREELVRAFNRVLNGELRVGPAAVGELADVIQPRLVRTPDADRRELAERLARAVWRAAPIVVEGGSEAIRLVVRGIDALAERERERERDAAAAGVRRVLFGLPLLAAQFTGRDAELAELDRLLGGADRAVVTQAIAGLGGVGKSQLAARYVHEHLDDYDIVAWIRAADGGMADLAQLAGELRELPQDLTVGERAAAAVRWLTVCEERWLLVLDNLASPEQLPGCCPRAGNGRVVVTTRDRAMQQFAPLLTVDVFDEDTAIDYLLARSGHADERAAARRVAEALGRLPLALAHAGAYCAQGTGLDDYLQLLEALPTAEVFDRSPEVFYRETVASTWQVSIGAAAADAVLAPDMLAMAALLAPDDIPRTLFDVLIDREDPAQRKALIDAAAALHRYSLAVVTPNALSVHRLLQRVVIDSDTTLLDDAAAAAISALTAAVPTAPARTDRWPAFEQVVPHILAFRDAHKNPTAAADQLIDLLNTVSAYLLRTSGPQRAIDAATPTNEHAQRLLGADHPETISACHHLALAYRSAGRTSDAIELFEHVLAANEHLLGPLHPNTLTALQNLGNCYCDADRTGDAITLAEQVLATTELVMGLDHPHTLSSYSNLADVYLAAGRNRDAIAVQKRALRQFEQVRGAGDPHTITALYKLALVYHDAGRPGNAITLFERVLEERVRLLGSEHPDTLLTRNSLAGSYHLAGRISDAITMQEQAVAQLERLMGAEHPDTIEARYNLANAYYSAGRTSDTIPLLEKVLADREQLLGAEHHATLAARHDLANCYHDAGRISEAITHLEHVLADRERLLGAEHPFTRAARKNLASYARRRRRITRAQGSTTRVKQGVKSLATRVGPSRKRR